MQIVCIEVANDTTVLDITSEQLKTIENETLANDDGDESAEPDDVELVNGGPAMNDSTTAVESEASDAETAAAAMDSNSKKGNAGVTDSKPDGKVANKAEKDEDGKADEGGMKNRTTTNKSGNVPMYNAENYKKTTKYYF